MEFVMGENIAVIPKGTKIQIMGCSYTLLEDVKVDGMQIYLDKVLKAQEDFDNQERASASAASPNNDTYTIHTPDRDYTFKRL